MKGFLLSLFHFQKEWLSMTGLRIMVSEYQDDLRLHSIIHNSSLVLASLFSYNQIQEKISAVTFRGHLPVILSAKSEGSDDMKQILIVEDDSFLNKMLAYNLTADGYGVTSALNARTAANAIHQREFDLVLLDINLTDGNGFELCKLIKPEHPDTIVIFLTANDQESDQIRGYEVGAVDQRKIKAMFAMLEHHKPAKDIYDDGRLFLDFSEQTATLNGKALSLSPMEFKMLNLFRKNPKQVLTRQHLLEKLWDVDERFVDEHTLTTSISRIRSKIEADGGAPYIKTIYGMGYQWTGGEKK